MEKITFTCIIENLSGFEDLSLEFWLDDHKFFDATVNKGISTITHQFDDDESMHSLRIILKNKSAEHTTVDESGKIIQDALLSIKNICFDDISIDQLFFKNAVYSHNFNDTGPDTEDQFYGDLGCNGEVELEFSTPIYLWLLEHM